MTNADLIEKLPRRCPGISAKTGEQCRNRPMHGLETCKQHSSDDDIGRRSMLTADKQQKIVEAVRAGNYREVAARYAGVSVSTLHAWLAKGRDDQAAGITSEHSGFVDAISRGEADFEIYVLAAVRLKVRDNPQLGLEVLSRKHPERWGRRDHHKLEHAGGVGVQAADSLFGPGGPASFPLELRQQIARMIRAHALANGVDLGVNAQNTIEDGR